ncbi:ATP-binding protein [Kitasatospora cinereorecta]|uniref:ATP-binding protein n=1 Tax=Kitasatospora cinereorecta TaxID=285560 RepID=A0ABW0VG70_9ACTN
MDGAGDRDGTRTLVLPERTGAVARSRAFTRTVLGDWGWTERNRHGEPDAVGDVLLMVSELVSNACMHAEGPYELLLSRVSRPGEVLRIEVVDRSPHPPVLRTDRSPADPGGHGLLVVDRLALAWGSEPRGPGKAVWLLTVLPPF